MKRELVYMDAKSSKFWNLELAGNSYTVKFGRLGTAGQSLTKSFPDEAAARKDAEKLIKEKLGKGYVAYFHWNLDHYASQGKPCAAGETTFTVDGEGNVRRCHFLDHVVGNIYEAGFGDCLKSRSCSAASCGCHIGYIHRPELELTELYGEGLLERTPARWPEVNADFARNARPAPAR